MTGNRAMRCLVVDDDHDGADIVGEFLNDLGAEVRVAYGGLEAIDPNPGFRTDVKWKIRHNFDL